MYEIHAKSVLETKRIVERKDALFFLVLRTQIWLLLCCFRCYLFSGKLALASLSLSSCCCVNIVAALTEVGEREVGERGHWIFGVFNLRPPLSNKKVYYI